MLRVFAIHHAIQLFRITSAQVIIEGKLELVLLLSRLNRISQRSSILDSWPSEHIGVRFVFLNTHALPPQLEPFNLQCVERRFEMPVESRLNLERLRDLIKFDSCHRCMVRLDLYGVAVNILTQSRIRAHVLRPQLWFFNDSLWDYRSIVQFVSRRLGWSLLDFTVPALLHLLWLSLSGAILLWCAYSDTFVAQCVLDDERRLYELNGLALVLRERFNTFEDWFAFPVALRGKLVLLLFAHVRLYWLQRRLCPTLDALLLDLVFFRVLIASFLRIVRRLLFNLLERSIQLCWV